MSLECVLFDRKGKEIDWYDPVVSVEETDKDLIIHHIPNTYKVPKNTYHHYIVREKKEVK